MIKIIAVGKIKELSLRELIEEYKKRLTSYVKLSIVELADEPTGQNNSAAQDELVKIKEGERILSQIKEKEYVILLDLKGKMISSDQLAEKISNLYTGSISDITFVIGGSLGVSQAVINRANYRWKLSDLTFPHQIVRLLLLEQIYRAYKINYHEPYHK